MNRPARDASHSGFTLLEILLVIVIMAVTAMMVVPNYIGSVGVTLRDESERLAGVLRLASEEAELSGAPVRFQMRQHSYQFYTVDGEGAWQAMDDALYQLHQLANGFSIAEIRPATPLDEQDSPESEREPVIASLVLLPEGLHRLYEISLSDERGQTVVVRLRPGPAGIYVASDDPSS